MEVLGTYKHGSSCSKRVDFVYKSVGPDGLASIFTLLAPMKWSTPEVEGLPFSLNEESLIGFIKCHEYYFKYDESAKTVSLLPESCDLPLDLQIEAVIHIRKQLQKYGIIHTQDLHTHVLSDFPELVKFLWVNSSKNNTTESMVPQLIELVTRYRDDFILCEQQLRLVDESNNNDSKGENEVECNKIGSDANGFTGAKITNTATDIFMSNVASAQQILLRIRYALTKEGPKSYDQLLACSEIYLNKKLQVAFGLTAEDIMRFIARHKCYFHFDEETSLLSQYQTKITWPLDLQQKAVSHIEQQKSVSHHIKNVHIFFTEVAGQPEVGGFIRDKAEGATWSDKMIALFNKYLSQFVICDGVIQMASVTSLETNSEGLVDGSITENGTAKMKSDTDAATNSSDKKKKKLHEQIGKIIYANRSFAVIHCTTEESEVNVYFDDSLLAIGESVLKYTPVGSDVMFNAKESTTFPTYVKPKYNWRATKVARLGNKQERNGCTTGGEKINQKFGDYYRYPLDGRDDPKMNIDPHKYGDCSRADTGQ